MSEVYLKLSKHYRRERQRQFRITFLWLSILCLGIYYTTWYVLQRAGVV